MGALAVLGGVGVCTSLATAGTIRHDVDDDVYTGLSADLKYAATGAVRWNENNGGWIGSGALIAPDWVLTAGHVVDGNNLAGGGITNLRFILGPSATTGTAVFADQWLPLPGWTGSLFNGFDIGLIHLSSDILSVEPAKRFFDEDERTMTATHVGYGLTGNGLNGTTANSAGTRRAGNNVLDDWGPDVDSSFGSNIVFTDFDRPNMASQSSMGSPTPLAREYMIAGGDSGGPVFVEVNGEAVIAAVHSFTRWIDGTNNSDYGDQSGSIRLNGVWQTTKIINDWISSIITVPGDADADQDVDIDDLSVLAGNYGMTTGGHWHLGDFDLDGDVDLSDLTRLSTYYDGGAALAMTDFDTLIANVPEPASTAGAVALSLMALVRRRRAGTNMGPAAS